jgi:hypothetical protein
MKYYNGRLYEGLWQKDMRDGHGFEVYSNGSTYHGNFTKGYYSFDP